MDSLLVKVNVQSLYTVLTLFGGGVHTSTNAIQVYVQTPTAIALEGEALNQYLHYALCPSPSKRIWQDIQARELSVYVFSHSIRKGERTVCN